MLKPGGESSCLRVLVSDPLHLLLLRGRVAQLWLLLGFGAFEGLGFRV